MVEAFNGNILCPNKHRSEETSFHKGHLLEAETYIGGHVECLETGVYRSDIKYTFDVDPEAVDELIRNIDRDLAFAIEVEAGMDRFDVKNYDEVSFTLFTLYTIFRYLYGCLHSLNLSNRCEIISLNL